MNNKQISACVVAGMILIALFGFYLFFLNHVEVNELGLAYNSLNGKVTTQTEPGWYVTHPFIKVAYLDLRPQVVHIPSAAKVINTKIVRFKPEGIQQFIELHGFGYSLGQNLNTLLMGYAFSGSDWQFLEICQEGGDEKLTPVRK